MTNEKDTNTYVVRHYFSKFIDVEVTATSLEEALEKAEIPTIEWFDDNDTAFVESDAELIDTTGEEEE